MNIAVLLVGHANFGKSRTLVNLTDSKSGTCMTIANKMFILQRKSNGDIGYDFINKINEYLRKKVNYLLLAFCPDFNDPDKYAEDVLKLIKENNFKIYSFILMQKYNNGEKFVSESEILKLKEFGDVFECDETDEWNRVEMLKEFIEKFLEELEEKIREQIAVLLKNEDDIWMDISYGEYDLELVVESANIEIDIQKNCFSFENVEFNSTNRFGDSENNNPEYFEHCQIVNGSGKFEYSGDEVTKISHIKITKKGEKDIRCVTKRYDNNTPHRP